MESCGGCLFDYCNTKHFSTCETPANLMFGRDLRSRLDLILPNKFKLHLKQNKDNHINNSRQLEIGDHIW